MTERLSLGEASLSPAKYSSSQGKLKVCAVTSPGFTCLPGIRPHGRLRESQEMELEGVARAQLPASGLM